MSLAAKKCIPCEGGVTPLALDEAKKLLAQVPGWEIAEGDKWLRRRFTFKDFLTALDFVNKAGQVAEEQGHHPDITFSWGYAEFRIQTHSIGGLHENDFILAAKINALS